MLNYLFKILITLVFSVFIIFLYYFVFDATVYKNGIVDFSHSMNFNGYIYYIFPLILFYLIYSFFKKGTKNKKISFSLFEILGYFFLNLLILSIFFFGINDFNTLDGTGIYPASTGIVLFFKIIGFLVFPSVLIFLSIAFGRKISKIFKILKEDKFEGIYNFLLSLGIGFFSFLFLITILGFFGLYNLYIVFLVLGFFLIFCLEEIGELWNLFVNYRIEFDNHNLEDKSLIKNINFKLLTSEFLFIVAIIVIGTDFINIIRPMPIGWDDLGVYMNYPRQMAHSGTIDFLGGMYTWQVLTGIGFMISEPVQAFFLNSIGGFLSFLVIILVSSDLLKDRSNKTDTLINIPLLLATFFISIPMVVFQQAKDMKLDEGLLFVSVIVLYFVIKLFYKEKSQNIFQKLLNKTDKKEVFQNNKFNYKIILIIGILGGFAFSIKITSLLLISAIIGVFFFAEIGLCGFLGYLGLYFALFTKAGLWSYLNIVYDKTDIFLINIYSLIFLIIGIIFLVLGIFKHKKNILDLIKIVTIFLLGFIIAILPWIGKNINQVKVSNSEINVGNLIGGHQFSFKPDFSKIYSEKELDIIKQKEKREGLNSSGTTTNEDFGRYFGYEKGINNYVKLPWNLTMQNNQKGEFTNITWLFFAFIPLLFLFLNYRRKGLEYGILIILLLELFLFIYNPSHIYLTKIFSQINLPEGYFVLFFISLIPFLFLILGLKKSRINDLFRLVLVFSFFYIFLFSISAYGVVWYGIVMYYTLLLLIGISLYKISGYKYDDSEKKKDIKLFGSFIIFSLFLVYFFLSVFPYIFTNLKTAQSPHFKAGKLDSISLVFAYHNDYKPILFNLNIDKKKLGEINKINLKDVLKPSKDIANNAKIYRLGTFLKYFISGNNHRLLEDALLTKFDKYFYDKNSIDNTIERMKKVGLKYLLVDLNAATIDNDPRHDLTRRYQQMLKTFTSDKLKLIETDSVCLKIALEDYKKSKKTEIDLNKYTILAGVNYYTFLNDKKGISQKSKLKACEKRIIDLVKNKKVNNKDYTYLNGIQSISSGSKVLFEIK